MPTFVAQAPKTNVPSEQFDIYGCLCPVSGQRLLRLYLSVAAFLFVSVCVSVSLSVPALVLSAVINTYTL